MRTKDKKTRELLFERVLGFLEVIRVCLMIGLSDSTQEIYFSHKD
jgi:hypothetical protein